MLGLELGADDYFAKPCTPRELSARLRAILRRTLARDGAERAAAGADISPLITGALSLYSAQRRITWAGQDLALTNAEFNLLEVLIQKAGQAVSKN